MKKISRSALVIILIILGMFIIPTMLESRTLTHDIEVKYSSMSFKSSEIDKSIMEVEYLIGIKNHGRIARDFRIKISPKDLEWFPYLHCIPETYTSEIISLTSGQGELMKLKTLYQSSEKRSTNGHLSDQDFIIELVEVSAEEAKYFQEWQEVYASILNGTDNPLENKATGYVFYDIDNNNRPELIMNYGEGRNIIYTADDNGPVLLEHIYNTLYLSPKKELVDYSGWGTGVGGVKTYYLEENTLKTRVLMSYDVQPNKNIKSYEQHGQEINEDLFNEELVTYTSNRLEFTYPNSVNPDKESFDINTIEIGKSYTIVIEEGDLYNYERLTGDDFDLLKDEEVTKLQNYMKENNLFIKAGSYDVNQVYIYEDFIEVFEFE